MSTVFVPLLSLYHCLSFKSDAGAVIFCCVVYISPLVWIILFSIPVMWFCWVSLLGRGGGLSDGGWIQLLFSLYVECM